MNVAVILAGGSGRRLGFKKPKQFMRIAGKTVLEHAVESFHKHGKIDEIAIVIHADFLREAKEMVHKNSWSKVKKVLNGGAERHESSLAAIRAYEHTDGVGEANFIFHDAARPLVSGKLIEETVAALEKYEAVCAAVPLSDTVFRLDDSRERIAEIPARDSLRRAQTPQGFKYRVIREAYEHALRDANMGATDDCGVVKKYLPNTKIYVVDGEERNLKLTYPEDVYVLERILQEKDLARGHQ